MPVLTHADLVMRAARWLRNTRGCSVVFTEFACSGGEIPDAIGWQYEHSILVECKTSRSDFSADKSKPWRRLPEIGMGLERYFMVPEGVITAADLCGLDARLQFERSKWGLLWVCKNHVRIVKKSDGFAGRGRVREIGFLVSMLRRAGLRIGSGATLNSWLKWDQRPKPTPKLTPGELRRQHREWLKAEAARA